MKSGLDMFSPAVSALSTMVLDTTGTVLPRQQWRFGLPISQD